MLTMARLIRKQLMVAGGRISEREKHTRQAGEWAFIFYRQAWISLAFGELSSGYLELYTNTIHPSSAGFILPAIRKVDI
jgi:hypothetical protein